jgi:catechol 2,3-dioxygenase-like lactoylglutathione lyase family enzyme
MTRLAGLTIAVLNLEAMAEFYGRVFGAMLDRREVGGGFALYAGRFAGGISLQLCPKGLAGIEASQNLHQLTIEVDDVAATVVLATRYGGSALGASAVRDPDGNSIELVGTSTDA